MSSPTKKALSMVTRKSTSLLSQDVSPECSVTRAAPPRVAETCFGQEPCFGQGGAPSGRVAHLTFRTPLWYIPVFGIDTNVCSYISFKA